jgi:hypothetical protein
MIKSHFGKEFDPLVKALQLAERMEAEGEDLDKAAQLYMQAAKFIHPALKAQDISIDGGLRVVAVDMTGYKPDDDPPDTGSSEVDE